MNKGTMLTIGGIIIVGVMAVVILSSKNSTPVASVVSETETKDSIEEVNKDAVASNEVSAEKDSDQDGITDNAEVLLGTDPQNPDTNGNGVNDKLDPNPTEATVTTPTPKPATTPTTQPATTELNDFTISEVLVENNVNPATGKDAPDHLEIILKSTGKADITNFSLYYTITDLVTKATQSYTMPLSGFALKLGETKSVHVDTSGTAGHFRANPNSLYYQSQNEMRVDVSISAPGHKTQTGTVKKDAGGAEEAD